MMISPIQRLHRDHSGTAIVELALAAPILAVLIMGAIDVGGAFSRRLAIEQGAQRAVEKVMQTTELANVQKTIADEVSAQANVSPAQVTVTFPRYCDDKKMPDVDRDKDTGLAEGDPCDPGETEMHYILVDVVDEYEPVFASLGMGKKLPNGNYRLQAKAGMRTR